jgi:hypothetical protein
VLQGNLGKFSSLGCAIVQAVYRLPVTGQARVQSQHWPCEVDDGQNDNGTFFLQVLWFSFLTIILPMVDTHIKLPVTPTRKTHGQVWEPSKSNALAEIGVHLTESTLHSLGLERVKVREKLSFVDKIRTLNWPAFWQQNLIIPYS